jgi:hypothetical protein
MTRKSGKAWNRRRCLLVFARLTFFVALITAWTPVWAAANSPRTGDPSFPVVGKVQDLSPFLDRWVDRLLTVRSAAVSVEMDTFMQEAADEFNLSNVSSLALLAGQAHGKVQPTSPLQPVSQLQLGAGRVSSKQLGVPQRLKLLSRIRAFSQELSDEKRAEVRRFTPSLAPLRKNKVASQEELRQRLANVGNPDAHYGLYQLTHLAFDPGPLGSEDDLRARRRKFQEALEQVVRGAVDAQSGLLDIAPAQVRGATEAEMLENAQRQVRGAIGYVRSPKYYLSHFTFQLLKRSTPLALSMAFLLGAHPALGIPAKVAVGTVFGWVGLMMSTPLLAVASYPKPSLDRMQSFIRERVAVRDYLTAIAKVNRQNEASRQGAICAFEPLSTSQKK